MSRPILETERLVLRPFTPTDEAAVQQLAGDARIARGTDAVPHPYPLQAARDWIAGQPASFASLKEIVYAVTLASTADLVGAISLLNISRRDSRAELGFWVGVQHWSQGYCTEAASALVDHAHRAHGLSKIVGRCLAWNTASARVMEKLGMEREGCLAKQVFRDGRFEDQLLFAVCLAGR
jgi:[ribosomal protein S5]-alanine N-acetyltransferase